ncbi:hypothetical protein DAPPUDRAFT_242548 [Daphnia pulex]|uniref:Uncharacterized protein n=1 Tax=Daphnia pulex TaxID=6669 RepID=E9GGX9_DAPPU|nr:hypothetical protein DAPPUDRAFT_242548 [Daphnia pulex]|eukprot:EFX81104.1 hypothetical protein DAPPUDRAFT_242548 [Daphnia pulex]
MEPSPKRTNGMELPNLTNEDAELIRELTAELEEILATEPLVLNRETLKVAPWQSFGVADHDAANPAPNGGGIGAVGGGGVVGVGGGVGGAGVGGGAGANRH